MRRKIFWFAWGVLFVLPVLYGIEIYRSQDLPDVVWWKWVLLGATVVTIYFARNPDDVLKHHVVEEPRAVPRRFRTAMTK